MILRTLTLVAALTALASPALAQSSEPETVLANYGSSWSFFGTAGTDNRSKGISKTEGEGFVGFSAEWTSASGLFYVAPTTETIKSSILSELEVDLAAGIRPEILGFDLDLSAMHRWQVDANPADDNTAWEFTGDIKRSIGPASARLRLQYSPDGIGGTKEWTWVEGRLGWEFTDRLKGTAAVGRREQENSVDYSAWNAGITYDLTDRLELDVRWYDTDAGVPTETYDSALVAAINVYF